MELSAEHSSRSRPSGRIRPPSRDVLDCLALHMLQLLNIVNQTTGCNHKGLGHVVGHFVHKFSTVNGNELILHHLGYNPCTKSTPTGLLDRPSSLRFAAFPSSAVTAVGLTHRNAEARCGGSTAGRTGAGSKNRDEPLTPRSCFPLQPEPCS